MKITKQRLKQIIKEELDATLNEASRKAGKTTAYQIKKLDPNFNFQTQPSDEFAGLMALQDIDNSNTATVYDANDNIVGTLDLTSSPKWLDSVIKYSPDLVRRAMGQYG